jgi:hypothetical protein
VPSGRLKRTKEEKENGEPHLVPLAKQAVQILEELFELTGHGQEACTHSHLPTAYVLLATGFIFLGMKLEATC